MNFYLLRQDGTISDVGDYPEEPAARPEGTWQQGHPPADSVSIQPLSERLRETFEGELPPEAQADLAPLKAAVKMELEQNRPHIARLIIERATIPDTLEMVRAALLTLLPNAEESTPEA